MSRLKCRCGTVLDDDKGESMELLLAVAPAKLKATGRAPTKDAAEGFRYALWRCRQCDRWWVFEPTKTTPKFVLAPED